MYEPKTFSIPALKGISTKTIEEHLGLYEGYVKNANLISDLLEKGSWEGDGGVYAAHELTRRFSFEWGGMRNHEVYFSLLEGGPHQDAPMLRAALEEKWGSFDAWLQRFKTIALTRGVGWAMLSHDPIGKQLVHAWVDEQHVGQLAGCRIIIALDMWEHSYVADYQPSGKKHYIDDFFENLNWSAAEKLFVASNN